MKYKMWTGLILFFTVWDIDIWWIASYELQGLTERKMDKFIDNEKYSHQNTLWTNQLRLFPQYQGWFRNPSINFDHGINWKGLCLVLSDWRVTWISLLECFCKSFIFLVPLLLKQKILKRDFWEVFFNYVLSVIGHYDPVSLQILCKKWDLIEEIDRGL